MAKKKQENPKLDLYRQRMSELIKGIFGYKQIDFEPKGDDTPKSVTIKLRHNGIVHKFDQTRTYQRNFRILFQYTFIPPDGTTLEFRIGNPYLKSSPKKSRPPKKSRQEYIHTILINAICFCVDEEMQESILKNYTLPLNKYDVTTRSILDVMANYDSINGTPVICSAEQMKACQEKFGNQTVPADQAESGVTQHFTVKEISEEIFHDHPEAEESYLGLIGRALVDRMLPLFFDETLSDEAFQQQYTEVLSELSEQIKEKLIEDAERIAVERKHRAENIKKIIFVDPAYQFDRPDMQVLYAPENSPVLTDWHVPVQQYVKYCKPEIGHEDVKTFLSCFVKGKPYPFALVHPEAIEPVMKVPISDRGVPYRQAMFDDFQIIYLTQEHNPQFTPSLFEYLGSQDEYIRKAIEDMYGEQLDTYWKSVFASVEDLLSRVFRHSEDFTALIQEVPLSRKEYPYQEEYYRKQGKGYQDYLAEYPDQKIDGLESWMEAFHQKCLLKLGENTFSAFLSQDLIYQHYVLGWDGLAEPYRDMLGEDYLAGDGTKQLAYVCIPLIGEVASELEENAASIAEAAKARMLVNQFQYHLYQVKKYLTDAGLDKAIQQWNETCQSARRRGTNSIHDFRGLLYYAQQNGNLFQNLKEALESYVGYLEA